jgi:hypothetical protein
VYVRVNSVLEGHHGNGAARSGDRHWRRLTEVRAGAKSVFHFNVQGSVAKSTHAGLPWLRHIRAAMGGRVHFWPFDGWSLAAGSSAIVEVYPSLWRHAFPQQGRNEHQHDAYCGAEWMRKADAEGMLVQCLNPPLTSQEREVASIEGWILGIMEMRRRLPKRASSAVESDPGQRDEPRVEGIDGFPPGVAEKLGTYVYRLIDPRNGETFYVGKGKGDRLFAHIRLGKALEGDELDNKVKRIRLIHMAGLEVEHVIHRHGMDDATAFEVEAALIDAYPGLTNIAGGSGGDFGVLHAKEVITRYCAEPAVFRHRALLISVNRSASEKSLYDAVRYAWKINPRKASQAEVVLATQRGMIVGAFLAREWLEATEANFPGFEAAPGRYAFIGGEAPDSIASQYVGKRVPDEYRAPGAANPIKYTWV